MNSGAKQRITGAFVLLALALIFFPLLFDFSDERRVDKDSTIPPQPDIKPAEIPEPVRPDNIIPAPSDTEIFTVEDEDEVAPQTAVQPALDQQGVPEAWVIQVASFRERQAALAMEQTLQADGYKSFVQEARATGDTTYRVLVGPKILIQDAQNEKQQIDRKYRVDALIMRFKP